MYYTFFNIWKIFTAYGYLGARPRKLGQPQWNVSHDIIIGTTFRVFIHPVQIMFKFCSIYSDANAKMQMILFYKPLYLAVMIINAVSRERKSI